MNLLSLKNCIDEYETNGTYVREVEVEVGVYPREGEEGELQVDRVKKRRKYHRKMPSKASTEFRGEDRKKTQS